MKLTLFADYYQIHVFDAGGDPAAISDLWDDRTAENLIASRGTVALLGTLRPMSVPVQVNVHQSAPPVHKSADHVAETDLTIPSGTVTVAGPTAAAGDRHTLTVTPGAWRLRWTITDADTVADDQMAGSEQYRLDLWPAREPGGLTVIRRWPQPTL